MWIDYFAGSRLPHVAFLDELLANPMAVAINETIYMELLQGVRDDAAFNRLDNYFGGQRLIGFADSLRSHIAAARIYVDCRRKGITIRSTIDCLVAQCAIENEAVLFHHDRDFLNMKPIVPKLRQKTFLEARN